MKWHQFSNVYIYVNMYIIAIPKEKKQKRNNWQGQGDDNRAEFSPRDWRWWLALLLGALG
jgi:hypothetical protein